METIICGGSAFAWWRTPPLVRALATASLGQARELGTSEEELFAAHSRCVHGLPFRITEAHPVGRPVHDESPYAVLGASRALSVCTELPVHVLVRAKGDRRRSTLVHPHVWSRDLPAGALVRVSDTLSVSSPAFTSFLVAAWLSLPRLVMAISELLGTFAVYRPPEPLRQLIEKIHAAGTLPDIGSWRPAFDRDGRLSDVWSRAPLVTAERLSELAASCPGARGRRRLETAVELTGHARQLAQRSRCYCDLHWEGTDGRRPVDVECKSAEHHANEKSYLSDADRAAALQLMGIEVVEVTFAQLANERRFDALSRLLASKLGTEPCARSAEFLSLRRALRREVLIDWLGLVGPAPSWARRPR